LSRQEREREEIGGLNVVGAGFCLEPPGEGEREREGAVSGATVCAFLGERDREEVIW
jgi:hypothetical protein